MFQRDKRNEYSRWMERYGTKTIDMFYMIS